MLPKEATEEFKKLYLARFGIQLTDEEASRRANNLVSLYKFVYAEPSSGPIKNIPTEHKKEPDKQAE